MAEQVTVSGYVGGVNKPAKSKAGNPYVRVSVAQSFRYTKPDGTPGWGTRWYNFVLTNGRTELAPHLEPKIDPETGESHARFITVTGQLEISYGQDGRPYRSLQWANILALGPYANSKENNEADNGATGDTDDETLP